MTSKPNKLKTPSFPIIPEKDGIFINPESQKRNRVSVFPDRLQQIAELSDTARVLRKWNCPEV